MLSDSFRIPNVSIKYSKTIRSTITNYKNTILSNIEHEHLTCDCSNSPYKDISHNHIVTGNLNIIDNSELRELLQKGLNYREQNPPNKVKALCAYSEDIDAYIFIIYIFILYILFILFILFTLFTLFILFLSWFDLYNLDGPPKITRVPWRRTPVILSPRLTVRAHQCSLFVVDVHRCS